MAYTTQQQRIYDHVVGSLPPWFLQEAGAEDFLAALVAALDLVRVHRETLVDQRFILTADNGVPDWLGEHASQHGTRQQSGEDADALRQRLRAFPDAVTPDAVAAAVNGVLAAAGLGTCALVDLRDDRAHFGSYVAVTGTGGAVAAGDAANEWVFTPTSPPSAPGIVGRDTVTLSSLAHPGNNGTFVITGYKGNGYRYQNASGVAEVAAGAAWSWDKRVAGSPAPQAAQDGHKRAYLSRGYRCGSDRYVLVVILPYPTDAGVAAGVAELLRLIVAGGVKIIVERRLNP